MTYFVPEPESTAGCGGAATAMSAVVLALQGDHIGIRVLLDGLSPDELRDVATAAVCGVADTQATLFAAAESLKSEGLPTPTQAQIDALTSILKGLIATLRVQAMD